MAYKRNIDRLPIIPADAKEHNVVCHFCIVGCGYKAYSWDINKQGGTAPDQNKFGVDLSQQQDAETAAWYSPSMYNIVKQDGRDVHLVIKPDKDCVVNSGLGSIRGARHGRGHVLARRPSRQLQRLTAPMVWRYGQMQPTSLGRRARSRRPGHGPRRSRSRARTGSSSRPSTMAAPAAATRTPGAPASSISAP